MTEAKKKPSAHVAFPLISLAALLLLLLESEIAVERMSYGLRLCVTSVIPALFPFMVVSELVVCSSALRPIGKLLARPCRLLFGIGEQSSVALLLGWLCGFPVGTRSAVKLCRLGVIDSDELSRLLCFVNLPSSAFLIGTVGTVLMGDRGFGIRLYVITLLSALLIGIATNPKWRKKRTQTRSTSSLKISLRDSAPAVGVRAVSESISASAFAMLRICAFIVFFSVLVGVLDSFVRTYDVPPELHTLLFGALEMTGGTASAAALNDPLYAEMLCMLLVGWSGISVHCQTVSLCAEVELSLRPYLLAKAAHGALNVLLYLAARQLCL